jgi:hypothetical protein
MEVHSTMTFEEKIKIFAEAIPEKIEHIDSEETTKIALILPLLREMGHDTTNPSEVKAEFVADTGVKKGEKVDIVILNNSKPDILIECKVVNTVLDKSHIQQLYRYFTVTDAKIGILTNGISYQFFTDSQKAGKMDDSPFLDIDFLDITDSDIKELEKFTKGYNIDKILARVDVLKYTHDIKKVLHDEIEMPSDEFVKVIAKQVYDGILTKKTRDLFGKIIKNNFNSVIDEKVDKRIKEALENAKTHDSEILTENGNNDGIITTKEELEGYYIVKSLLSEIISLDRIAIRDAKSYCSILLDDNKYYPICRMHFNDKKNMKINFFDSFEKDDAGRKKVDTVSISNLEDMHNYKERFIKTVKYYERLLAKKKK